MIETKVQVLPLGRFKFIAGADTGFAVGGFVLLDRTSGQPLGQVTDARLEYTVGEQEEVPGFSMNRTPPTRRVGSYGSISGEGVMLGEWTEGKFVLGDGGRKAEGDYTYMDPAKDDMVEGYFSAAYAAAENKVPFSVGRLLCSDANVDVKLLAAGFSRPTGLFGQSGSGKSFALGSIIEGLMHHSQVDIIVMDPNGDFLGLNGPLLKRETVNYRAGRQVLSEEEYNRLLTRHEEVREVVQILSSDVTEGRRAIGVLPSDLEDGGWITLLGLDPGRDLAACRVLRDELARCRNSGEKLMAHLLNRLKSRTAFEAAGAAVAAAMDNMGLSDKRMWARPNTESSITQIIASPETARVLVVDLSSCDRSERTVVATTALRAAWDRQQVRKREGGDRATVVVVDEAHSLFPSRPESPCDALALRWGVMVAGEGRKYGLYLIVASQLPSKIHEHVITQCGNLVLLRMVSTGEIRSLQSHLSFASESFLELSRSFKPGDALVMGGITPTPVLTHFERRLTEEGGGDMRVSWAPAVPPR
jgi:hypothetical protein